MDNGLSVWEWMLSYVFIGNSSLIRRMFVKNNCIEEFSPGCI